MEDSFGMVYPDAWMAGKPVIAADCGLIPEVVRDNERGVAGTVRFRRKERGDDTTLDGQPANLNDARGAWQSRNRGGCGRWVDGPSGKRALQEWHCTPGLGPVVRNVSL